MAKNIHFLPILGLIIPILAKLVGDGTWMDKINAIQASYTGYDMGANRWDASQLMGGLVILIVTLVISFLFGKTGMNRYLPKGINV